MELVIGVGIQAAETVAAGVIGVTAAHGIGAYVLQENNAAGKKAIGLVRHNTPDRTQLCFVFLVLGHTNGRKQQKNHSQSADGSPQAHPLPPVVGSILKIKLSSFSPAFASMMRLCSAKPFTRTTISESEPWGTRTANS